jgi:hypothetical protein
VSRAGDSTNQIGNHVGSVAKMSMDSKVGNKGSLATEKSCPFGREVILEVVEKMLETVDRRKPLRRSRRVALSLLMRLTRFVLRATQVGSRSADASAEGVQRDLLPLIEERSSVPSTATSIPITFSLLRRALGQTQ